MPQKKTNKAKKITKLEEHTNMAQHWSDWALLGGLLVANAAAGINSVMANTAPAFLVGLGGYASLAVAVGAGYKLFN